ncbi:MAG: hypothetical protein Q4F72_10375 [Desulfovibrionaceae bacterium]|nr:hypothetical protein [Desulfovibrionaceae bacterium]
MDLFNFGKDLIRTVSETVGDKASAAADAVSSTAAAAAERAKDAASAAADAVGSTAATAAQKTKDAASAAVEAAQKTGTAVAEKVQQNSLCGQAGGIARQKAEEIASKVISPLLSPLLEKQLEGIVRVRDVRLRDRRPEIDVELEGLVGVYTIRIGRVEISGDGSTVTVGNYGSNLLFLQNALNKFAQQSFATPDNVLMRKNLPYLKMVL